MKLNATQDRLTGLRELVTSICNDVSSAVDGTGFTPFQSAARAQILNHLNEAVSLLITFEQAQREAGRAVSPFNPEAIQRGDIVALKDKPGHLMTVACVGGKNRNKVLCVEMGMELYATCFRLVTRPQGKATS